MAQGRMVSSFVFGSLTGTLITTLSKRFKLHLRSKSGDIQASGGHIKPLPLGKTVVEVLSDFLKYLDTCAKQYIKEVHPGIGSDVWDGREIHYILSHPNGWEGPQRTLMKQAAEKAGLISSSGRNQLSFITEGEASLNRCIEKGLMTGSVRVSWYTSFQYGH
jgi:hypothetical protein